MKPRDLEKLLATIPDDWQCVGNAFRNLMLLDAAGLYRGYIDLRSSELDLIPEQELAGWN